MKVFTFILYCIKNGSLKSRPLNFDQRKLDILGALIPGQENTKKGLYRQVRDKLVSNPYTSSLTGTLAYLKSYKMINKQFFFSDTLKLCYIRIFKSASTSVLRELLPLIDITINTQQLNDLQVDVLANEYVKTNFTSSQKDYEYFTLVRNPFHRIVSVYLDLFDKQDPFFSYQTYFFGILKREMTFTEFIVAISKIPDPLKSPHFASQYQIINTCGGLAKIKCFRIEKDQAALSEFLSRKNLIFHHSNKHKNTYNFNDFYNLKTLDIVYAMYRTDVDTFDYQNEYAALRKSIS